MFLVVILNLIKIKRKINKKTKNKNKKTMKRILKKRGGDTKQSTIISDSKNERVFNFFFIFVDFFFLVKKKGNESHFFKSFS